MGDEVPMAHVIDVKSKEGERVMAAKASEGKELGTSISMVVQAEGLEFETLATLDKVYILQKVDLPQSHLPESHSAIQSVGT